MTEIGNPVLIYAASVYEVKIKNMSNYISDLQIELNHLKELKTQIQNSNFFNGTDAQVENLMKGLQLTIDATESTHKRAEGMKELWIEIKDEINKKIVDSGKLLGAAVDVVQGLAELKQW